MAEFPPNLDDGELWLPSYIIGDVGVQRRRHQHHHHRHYHDHDRSSSGYVSGFLQPPCDFTSLSNFHYDDVEDLASQLAALGLLDRSPLPPGLAINNLPPLSRHSPSNLDRFTGDGLFHCFGKAVEPDVRPVNRPSSRRLVAGAGDGGLRLGMSQFELAEPVRAQVEAFGPERKEGGRRVLQRSLPPPAVAAARSVQRQFSPVRGCGSGMGTGVFIPRLFNSNGANERKKKTQWKEEQQKQQPQFTRNAMGLKQGMPFQPPPVEMGLPQDWTY